MKFTQPQQTGQYVDLRSLGNTGLRAWSGRIAEETLRELEGRRAVEAYKDMTSNDATCGVIVYAIDKILRKVSWHVEPASTAPFDVEAADFVESCMHDMDVSWTDFIGDALTGMLIYGFTLREQVFKRRAGDAQQGHLRSKYSDGRIGWRDLAGRSQDTIYRWLFDDAGRLLGAEQQAPPRYNLVTLPIEKCLLFRTTTEKDSPEGRSVFRSAYRSWMIKRGIENIEAVGVEKDISGLPIVWVPRELLAKAQQNPMGEDGKLNEEILGAINMVEQFKKMATEIRRDAHEGLVMPLEFDEGGRKQFDISLLASGGNRQFDLDKIVTRYDQRVAMSVMADFLLLGQGATAQGSWAMHSDKTKLWLQSLEVFLNIFCETLNNKAIPQLMRYNTFRTSQHPRIAFGSLQQIDLAEQGAFLTQCAQAGMEVFPDENLEAHFRRAAGWPEKTSDLGDLSDIRPQPNETTDEMRELVSGNPEALFDLEGGETVLTNVRPPENPVTNETAQVYGL